MNKIQNNYDYDVAFSFAGEDRAFVESVAEILKEKQVKVFYDYYEKASLWGKDLYTHLDEIYRSKAKYCVIFISEYYVKKLWTDHERRSSQARAFQENREYILPFRLDDTQVPGILPTTGYISIKDTNNLQLAELILCKLSDEAEMKAGKSEAKSDMDKAIEEYDKKIEAQKKRKEKIEFLSSQQGCDAALFETARLISIIKEKEKVLDDRGLTSGSESSGINQYYVLKSINFSFLIEVGLSEDTPKLPCLRQDFYKGHVSKSYSYSIADNLWSFWYQFDIDENGEYCWNYDGKGFYKTSEEIAESLISSILWKETENK